MSPELMKMSIRTKNGYKLLYDNHTTSYFIFAKYYKNNTLNLFINRNDLSCTLFYFSEVLGAREDKDVELDMGDEKTRYALSLMALEEGDA